METDAIAMSAAHKQTVVLVKINGRTPEEIKSGLRHCWVRCKGGDNGECPYYADCKGMGQSEKLEKDALALIEYLEERQMPELEERMQREITRRDNLLAEMGIHMPEDEPMEWEYKHIRGAWRRVSSDGWVICPRCKTVQIRLVGTWYKHCPECGKRLGWRGDNDS